MKDGTFSKTITLAAVATLALVVGGLVGLEFTAKALTSPFEAAQVAMKNRVEISTRTAENPTGSGWELKWVRR